MLVSPFLLAAALAGQVLPASALESLTLNRQPTRRTHPDENVRLAWARDQVINTRLKYRSLLDEPGRERLARDVAHHTDHIERLQRRAKRDGVNAE